MTDIPEAIRQRIEELEAQVAHLNATQTPSRAREREYAAKVAPLITKAFDAGFKAPAHIARHLTANGVATFNGKPWTPTLVKRLIKLAPPTTTTV